MWRSVRRGEVYGLYYIFTLVRRDVESRWLLDYCAHTTGDPERRRQAYSTLGRRSRSIGSATWQTIWPQPSSVPDSWGQFTPKPCVAWASRYTESWARHLKNPAGRQRPWVSQKPSRITMRFCQMRQSRSFTLPRPIDSTSSRHRKHSKPANMYSVKNRWR